MMTGKLPNLSGQTFGGYRLERKLGEGGMASVYLSYQEAVKRQVAIKVLPPQLALQKGYVERFKREVELAARLEHPHILPIYDYGTHEGSSYIVMRLVDGGSLQDQADYLRQAATTELIGILKQVAAALDYAHTQGIVHRDIKASNILFDRQKNAYLADFGIAKAVQESAMGSLTGTDQIVGTPTYMPPEQWRGETLDGRADVYAFGVMVYQLLTGEFPFSAPTPFAMMHKHLNEDIPDLTVLRHDLSSVVNAVLRKALAKDRETRYNNAGQFIGDLEAAFAGKATSWAGGTLLEAEPMEGETKAWREPTLGTNRVEPRTTANPPLTSSTATLTRQGIPWVLVAVLLMVVGALAAFVVIANQSQEEPSLAEALVAVQQTQTAQFTSSQIASPTTRPPDTSTASITPRPPTQIPTKASTEVAVIETASEITADQGVFIQDCSLPIAAQFCLIPREGEPLEIALDGLDGLPEFNLSWSPDGEQVAFTVLPTGGSPNQDYLVYTANRDGSNINLLKAAAGNNDLNPTWSPDGDWIAFHSGCSLSLIHPDGSGLRLLSPHDPLACVNVIRWSPDSQWIAFTTMNIEAQRDPQILLANLNTDTLYPLYIPSPFTQLFDLLWSPTGEVLFREGNIWFELDPRCILAAGGCTGNDVQQYSSEIPAEWYPNFYPIWDGAVDLNNLLPIPLTEALPSVAAEIIAPATPNPAYAELGGQIVENCTVLQKPAFCIIPDTGDPSEIELALAGQIMDKLSWSPTGDQVTFSFVAESDDSTEKRQIYVANRDGSNLIAFPTQAQEGFPVWSPDGSRIAYSSNCALQTMLPNGEQVRVLIPPDPDNCVQNIRWSPDSQRLLLITNNIEQTDSSQLGLYDIENQAFQQLYQVPNPTIQILEALWTPHGEAIFATQVEEWQQVDLTCLEKANGCTDEDVQPYNEEVLPSWYPNYFPLWGTGFLTDETENGFTDHFVETHLNPAFYQTVGRWSINEGLLVSPPPSTDAASSLDLLAVQDMDRYVVEFRLRFSTLESRPTEGDFWVAINSDQCGTNTMFHLHQRNAFLTVLPCHADEDNDEETWFELSRSNQFYWEENHWYAFKVTVDGDFLEFRLDDEVILQNEAALPIDPFTARNFSIAVSHLHQVEIDDLSITELQTESQEGFPDTLEGASLDPEVYLTESPWRLNNGTLLSPDELAEGDFSAIELLPIREMDAYRVNFRLRWVRFEHNNALGDFWLFANQGACGQNIVFHLHQNTPFLTTMDCRSDDNTISDDQFWIELDNHQNITWTTDQWYEMEITIQGDKLEWRRDGEIILQNLAPLPVDLPERNFTIAVGRLNQAEIADLSITELSIPEIPPTVTPTPSASALFTGLVKRVEADRISFNLLVQQVEPALADYIGHIIMVEIGENRFPALYVTSEQIPDLGQDIVYVSIDPEANSVFVGWVGHQEPFVPVRVGNVVKISLP